MNVAIIGASDKPDRFAYRAQKLLSDNGHRTFPVSLSGKSILGEPGFQSVLDIGAGDLPVHTVTVYLNPMRFAEIADEVRELNPARIIFNPGTESEELALKFRESGIRVIEACTLIMLEDGTFDDDSDL